jgi:transposase
MFVRKKKNRSGVISVQIIDKSTGKYKMIKTIGSSYDADHIEKLVKEGENWIKQKLGLLELDFSNEKQKVEQFFESIEQITVYGTELLLGKLFDEIGFNQIPDVLFRQLVLTRLCFPVSKLKTTDYLTKYQFFSIDVQNVYRYLDRFYRTQKETVQRISYDHTLKVLGGEISIIFYDVTTLYFEIDDEDDLRRTGFSKEGKHQNPQIVLGLLVSIGGYPLAYEIFEGNKFEGHTMLPVIEAFKIKYSLNNLAIIADSGLLSNDNIQELQQKGYNFILGARIKSESRTVKNKILSLQLKHGESKIISKNDKNRLIINYSESRAKKDKANREKGLRKLEKQIKSGRLTKANINNRGYNKYLKIEGEVKISIDKEKLAQDARWDGLKGYLTNTKLTKEEIIENYGHLWKIEKAFRISKHDLRIRPIYHRLHRRIEAHICIAFVAYKVYKELERQLEAKKSTLSPEKAIEIAKTIYSIKVKMPTNSEVVTKTILLTEEQKILTNLFDL